MAERPILFSGPMVRAILAGQKTQTRRVVNFDRVRPTNNNSRDSYGSTFFERLNRDTRKLERVPWTAETLRWYFDCPYGALGDRLWVRESWNAQFAWDDEEDDVPYAWAHETERRLRVESRCQRASYAADESSYWVVGGRHGICSVPLEAERYEAPPRWMPSIHMPRWASRLTLEITDVRAEPVQEITEADAVAEGVKALQPRNTLLEQYGVDTSEPHTARSRFGVLWDSINGPRGYDWDSNPWVWVLTFKRVDGEVSHG